MTVERQWCTRHKSGKANPEVYCSAHYAQTQPYHPFLSHPQNKFRLILDNNLLCHAVDYFCIELCCATAREADLFGQVIWKDVQEVTIPVLVK